MVVHINYLAVLVAAILNMAIGALWYSPLLFARPWMRLTGRKMGEGNAGLGYALAALCSLVTAYVLAHFISLVNANSFGTGAATGFWAWLGFVATAFAASFAFEGRPSRLFGIVTGYSLVSLVLMGGLLGAWQ